MASILGINPVAGVVTTFKVRFQPIRDIPANAEVQIRFPSAYKVESDAIASKRNIEIDFGVNSVETSTEDDPTIVSLGFPIPKEDPNAKPKKGATAPAPPSVSAKRVTVMSNLCVFVTYVVSLYAWLQRLFVGTDDGSRRQRELHSQQN